MSEPKYKERQEVLVTEGTLKGELGVVMGVRNFGSAEIGYSIKFEVSDDTYHYLESELSNANTKAEEQVSAFKLVKDGHDWDYSEHLDDIFKWFNKIMLEEPESVVEIHTVTQKELEDWRNAW